MKKINKKDIIIFSIMLIITLIIFSKYLTGYFATDTYSIYLRGYEDYAIKNSLNDGRIIMGLIGILANMINIPIKIYTIILITLSLVTSCFSIMILKNMILELKDAKSKVVAFLVTIISYYTIFNFMYIENLGFVECFVMALSILFYLLATKNLITQNKKSYIKATIFLILGVMSYQGTISMYFLSVFVFSILKEENIKNIAKNIVICIVMAIVAVIVNYLEIKLVGQIFGTNQTRTSGFSNLKNNIIYIINNSRRAIIYTGSLLPQYWYLGFLSIIETVVIIKSIIQKNPYIIMEQLMIIIVSIILGFIISVIDLSGFWSGRIRFSIGATIGFLFLHLYVKTNWLEEEKISNNILIVIFLVYGIINTVTYINVTNIGKMVNELDQKISEEIKQYMIQYEEQTNIKVTKIAIINGGSTIKAYYKELGYKGAVPTTSAVRTSWAVRGIINYYTQKELEEVSVNKKQEEYYIENVDKNKEYMCVEDTLYITSYMY